MSVATLGSYRFPVAAAFKREFILTVRYPVNAAGLLVSNFALFLLLLVGGRAFSASAMADSVGGIVVGYLLWMMATTCFQGISGDIGAEAGWGTLERHLMTPYGFSVVMLAKSVAKLALNFVYAAVLLVPMLALTGTTLRIDLLTVVPLTVLTLASVFGLGFALGGLTLLYKNVTNWMGLFQIGLASLVAAPVFGGGWLMALPLAQGSAMLQRAMRDGVRLWEFAPETLGVLLATGLGYLLVGHLVFQVCQRRARRLGVLGDY